MFLPWSSGTSTTTNWPAPPAGSHSDGDHDLSRGVAVDEVANRVGRVGEGIAAVDDRSHGAGLDEPGERLEVLGAVLGDQATQPLADEDRDQWRPQLPVEAAEQPAPTVLTTDQDQRPVRRQRMPQQRQPTVPGRVDDHV